MAHCGPWREKQTSPSANRVRILIQYLSHLAVSQLLSWVPYETSVVIDVGPLFLGTMHIVDKPSELIDRFLHCHTWKYKINLLGDAGVLFGEMCVWLCVCVSPMHKFWRAWGCKIDVTVYACGPAESCNTGLDNHFDGRLNLERNSAENQKDN